METIPNYLLIQIKQDIRNGLHFGGFKFTDVNYFPNDQKYSVSIEVKIGEVTHILHANEPTMYKIADSLNFQYQTLSYANSTNVMKTYINTCKVCGKEFTGNVKFDICPTCY